MKFIDKLNNFMKKFNFPDDFTSIISMAIQPIDSTFNSDDIIQYAKNLFFIVSDCYCDNEYESLRAICSDKLYNTLKDEIITLSNENKRKVIEEVKITRPFLHLYRRNNNYEFLSIVLTMKLKLYISDNKHKNILFGSDELKSNQQFMLILKRNLGTLTQLSDRKNTGRYCPNCEKPIDFNTFAICSHCDKVINTGEYNWILDDFMFVTNETNFDNRGVIIET